MHRYKELPKITVFFLLISIVTGALVTGRSAYSKGKLQHRIGGLCISQFIAEFCFPREVYFLTHLNMIH